MVLRGLRKGESARRFPRLALLMLLNGSMFCPQSACRAVCAIEQRLGVGSIVVSFKSWQEVIPGSDIDIRSRSIGCCRASSTVADIVVKSKSLRFSLLLSDYMFILHGEGYYFITPTSLLFLGFGRFLPFFLSV